MVFFFTPRGHGPGPEDWLLYMVRSRDAGILLRIPTACMPPLFAAAACNAAAAAQEFTAPVLHITASRPLACMQGADKYENEDLIKYSLPHDVWFHVDNLSSAHVYLRLPQGGCCRARWRARFARVKGRR